MSAEATASDRRASASERRATGATRARVLGTLAGLIITGAAVILIPLGLVTGFRARRLYSTVARGAARAILFLYGVRVRVVKTAPFPRTQTIYISNHTSTLDLFVLVAIGLPNCRFFLSGSLRKYVPLGVIAWTMGTFFTVPQDRPEERRRIFARAERVLRRTRESVYLSPEGGRITTGEIGHFNKGAFHLATSLASADRPALLRDSARRRSGAWLQRAAGCRHRARAVDDRDARLGHRGPRFQRRESARRVRCQTRGQP